MGELAAVFLIEVGKTSYGEGGAGHADHDVWVREENAQEAKEILSVRAATL